MAIFNSYFDITRLGKPPFSYGFPMVFLWFSIAMFAYQVGYQILLWKLNRALGAVDMKKCPERLSLDRSKTHESIIV